MKRIVLATGITLLALLFCGNLVLTPAVARAASARGSVDPAVLLAVQQAELTGSPAASYSLFGCSVAISGDTALVGASGTSVNGHLLAGAAYVFVRSGTTWSQQAEITASDAANYAGFGNSVTLDGDTALIGADGTTVNRLNYAGAAYAFIRSGTTWSQQAELVASDAAPYDMFGTSVSLSGDSALIGATGNAVAGHSDAGAAYVFVRSGSLWGQQTELSDPGATADDSFGSSVALEGDTAFVGAPGVSVGGNAGAGAAYCFARTDTTWSQQTPLTASDPAAGDNLGYSLALDGSTVLIGAYRAGIAGRTGAGAAYIFAGSGSSWTQQAKVSAADAATSDSFGWSVALSGGTALIGALNVGPSQEGATYVFGGQGAGWTQQAKLKAPDAVVQEGFGCSVALDSGTALIGGDGATAGGTRSAGAAYVYQLSAQQDTAPVMSVTSPAGGRVEVSEGQTATASGAWSDADGDTVALSASVGVVTENANGTWSWNYVTTDGPTQSQAVTITADDGRGGVTTATFDLVVDNVAPAVVTPAGPSGSITTGAQAAFSGAFTDPGSADTHTAVWNWGDASTSVGTVTESGGSGSVAGTHIYSAIGTYTVTLTVTDKDGGVGNAGCSCVVVAPATTLWAAGAGWITSTAGSYPAKPQVHGRATFSFAATRAASGSTAWLDFAFPGAGLSFKTSTCVSVSFAAGTATILGTGKLDRVAGYSYLLSVIDAGNASKLRVKIWKTATGTVVYDSQPGAANSVGPTTLLGDGWVSVMD